MRGGFQGIGERKEQAGNIRLRLIGSSLLLVALGWGYLSQVNAVTAKGFAIRRLEKEVAELQVKNEKLSLELSSLQALDTVEAKIKMMGLVEVGDVVYLTPMSRGAAKK